MERQYPPRYDRRRTSKLKVFMLLFFCGVLLTTGGWYGYMKYIPNMNQVDPQYSLEHPITIHGEVTDFGAIIENDIVKLPLPLLEEWLGEDNPIRYEAESGTLIFTTANHVLKLKTDSLTGKLNQKSYELRVAAESKDGVVYIPAEPLEELYGVQVNYYKDSGIAALFQQGQAVQWAKSVKEKGAAVRTGATIRAPYMMKLAQDQSLQVWKEAERKGWYLVQTEDGHIGYTAAKDIALTQSEQIPALAKKEPFVAWKLKDSKINMTWEAVYNKPADHAKIPLMQGLNVVSPTWFELIDGKGTIKGKADPGYVKWAHGQGFQVWALVSNGFEPKQTSEALATAESRFSMIQQLLAFAEIYNLQGINIDFENVYTKDKENFVQFVRELTPLLHEQGLVVSVDVTPKSNSEMWSVFLDRPALGKIVDFMMVMAYDEHWGSSPKSGSVASLPWTENSIKRILEEDGVPSEKLILSMPLYTRVWTEKAGEDGKIKVSSKALGMDTVKKIIAEKSLTPVMDVQAGQYYVEYKEDGALKRIWIEDDVSISARIALVKKYNLAGVATWQRTFQTASIWKTIDEQLKK